MPLTTSNALGAQFENRTNRKSSRDIVRGHWSTCRHPILWLEIADPKVPYPRKGCGMSLQSTGTPGGSLDMVSPPGIP